MLALAMCFALVACGTPAEPAASTEPSAIAEQKGEAVDLLNEIDVSTSAVA